MVNKVKRIAVFVILIAVLTFGTGIMSRSSQVEGTAEKPGIIKSKNLVLSFEIKISSLNK